MEHGDVVGTVDAHDVGRFGLAVRERDRDGGGPFDRVGRREHVAVGAVDHPGSIAVTRVVCASMRATAGSTGAAQANSSAPVSRGTWMGTTSTGAGFLSESKAPTPSKIAIVRAEPTRAAAEPTTHTRAATFGRFTIVTDCDAPPGPSSDGCRQSRSSGGSGG